MEMQRILAVDDDKDILDVLQLILEDSGYEVEILADGHHFLEKIEEVQPDLIILDVMLGDMDGRDLCRTIKAKQETHNIPVIMLSASHTINGDLTKNGNPDDFISKPFDIEVLLDTVERRLAA